MGFPSVLLAVVVILAPWSGSMNNKSTKGIGLVADARRAEVSVDEDPVMYDDDDYDDYDDEIEDEIFETYSSPSRRAEYEEWANNEQTTTMWQLIDQNDLMGLKQLIAADPDIAHIRSEDGRGPLFWAYEYERYDIVQFLLDNGAEATAVDARGITPIGLMGKDERREKMTEEDDEEEDDDWEYDDDEEE